ncbi:hypothetical protein PG993_000989 [Apiospora rasikravindrae]|uniref:Apple domain-containing protein n=1 Tax=Apiospora rasikravindrae TaxID=990691 RepID=A0ABR1UAM7_9PEZI
MAFIHDDQPGLEVKPDLQPGLEVVPEPEAPQVVSGPMSQKPWDQRSPNSLPYHQQQQQQQYHQATSPVHEYNDQSPYSPYPPYPPQPPSSFPGAMSDWNGTVGPSPSERAAREPTIMGIRRKKFWLIVGPLIAVFVIGVAVGLGVGLGSQHGSSDDSPSATPSPSVVTSIVCPANNGSYYDSNDKKKRFQVACNLDYHSGGGSQDMGDFQTATFEDCLNGCAANDACVGAGWGVYNGATRCWLKSHLGSNQMAPNWIFGVRQ